jgi:cytoplasmic iron level regulating protein YaaA (DUF328/UPF0246 family)
MLALVSPAKKLDFDKARESDKATQPVFQKDIQELVTELKKLGPDDIQDLMSLSVKLAELNYNRYQQFSDKFDASNSKPAAYLFRGDTYVGLDADSLSSDDMDYAQDHLRMLSGLYGLLRPLDLMQPYRLEMGTSFTNPRGKDLYAFWGDLLTKACNEAVKDHKDQSVINLASGEYIKAINAKKLDGPFVTCHFKEMKNGAPKVIGLFAKRARGMMARYMIQNRIETVEGLKGFNSDGYEYREDLSEDRSLVFVR